MIVKFFLRQAIVDWVVPETDRGQFSFIGLCRGIRCDGFFQSPDMHIPYTEIIAIGMDNSVKMHVMPNAPAPETRQ